MQHDPRSDVDDMVADLRDDLDGTEHMAKGAQPGPWHIGNAVDPTKPCNVHTFAAASGVADNVRWLDAEHIARHDPARVLRLVAAHREILDECERVNEGAELGVGVSPEQWLAQQVIGTLAAAYADRDDEGRRPA